MKLWLKLFCHFFLRPSLARDDLIFVGMNDENVEPQNAFTLTFNNATARTLCVGVRARDDDIAEGMESGVVTLMAVDPADTIGVNSTIFTIIDNDGECGVM